MINTIDSIQDMLNDVQGDLSAYKAEYVASWF